jgi:hypothetical protein
MKEEACIFKFPICNFQAHKKTNQEEIISNSLKDKSGINTTWMRIQAHKKINQEEIISNSLKDISGINNTWMKKYKFLYYYSKICLFILFGME